jgi:DNA processing protein
MRDEAIFRLALTQINGLGPLRISKLLETFDSAEHIFNSTASELREKSGCSLEFAQRIISSQEKAFLSAREQLAINQGEGGSYVLLGDLNYPAELSRCPDAPHILFYKGKLPDLGTRLVSIVGTRKATEYGKDATDRIVEVLAECNATIVSGLAYGIDIRAHRKAIELNIPTLAVLGSGLGRIYPGTHRSDVSRLIGNGAVISEYLHNQGPDREHFPVRNRIVAGLSVATIVVEAGKEGGAWITARLANEYGREVLAVPGKWNSAASEGCHILIARHTAAILTSPVDIPSILGWEIEKTQQTRLFPPEENEIAQLLARNGAPMHLDDLARLLNCPVSDLSSRLLKLELDSFIKWLPGRFLKLNGEFNAGLT